MQGMLAGIERTIPKKGWMTDYEFILVQSIDDLAILINKAIKKSICAFDLESTGLDTRIFNGKCNCQVVGYSIAFEPKKCYYIPIRHKIETSRGVNLNIKETNFLIQKLINEGKIVGHNWLKFDIEMLFASEGISLRKIVPGQVYPYHDTYVLARLAGMNPAGLKPLSKKLLDKEMIAITEIVNGKKDIDFGSVSPYEGCLYAASDAICTFELWHHSDIQKPIKEQAFIYTIERKLLPVVRRMERNKIKLDIEHCKRLDNELITEIEERERDIYRMVSEKTDGKITQFKIDSPADMSRILFDIFDMNPKPELGKTGNYKTDDSILETLAAEYPLAKKLQEYRTSAKFHRTYIKNMLINVDSEGYLKFNFSALRTDSGRFASPGKANAGETKDGCSGVNIQATPARYDKTKPNVRKCISCEDDEVIVAMDWAGVELRVATNMSLEPIWLNRFLKGDGDLHTSTAAIIHDIAESVVDKAQRQVGKCAHPDSLLFINNAYMRIGSLHSSREADTFYELQDNLEVQVSSSKKEKIEQFYSNGVADSLLMCSTKGVSAVSLNHKFELDDGSLIRACDLKKGDILKNITVNLKGTISDDCVHKNLVTKNVSYQSGLLLGDSSPYKIGYKLVSKNESLEWKEEINNILKILWGNSDERDTLTPKSFWYLSDYNSAFESTRLLQDERKIFKIHESILNGSLEIKYSFLIGLLGTSCAYSDGRALNITHQNWIFIQDVCVLLASLGLPYSLGFKDTFCASNHYYYINLNYDILIEHLRCCQKNETMPLVNVSDKENVVLDVMPMGKLPLVDIGVASDEHMYLLNNFRTHNTFNFQSIYGGGPGALASTLKLTYEDAKEKQMRFFGRLTKINQWIRSLQFMARKKGYCVTQFGRKRMLPEFESEIPRIQANAKRKAVNTPVQGSSADLMKIAMILIDKYLDENNLRDKVQMLLTMHDELVFRIKKTSIDVIPEIEKVMQLDNTIKKIKWQVPLVVDVELGSSWDIHFEYADMLEYLNEKHNQQNVAFIYESGQNYEEHLKNCSDFKKEKKECHHKKIKEEKNNPINKEIIQKEDFKKEALDVIENQKKIFPVSEKPVKSEKIEESIKVSEKTVIDESSMLEEKTAMVKSLGETTASASELDKYFNVMTNVNLSDLPDEAYQKLKKNFYEKEVERILEGLPSIDDLGIEMSLIVHNPIDNSKLNLIGYIIDSCPGKGRLRFLTDKKEDLHPDWVNIDVLKATIMSKIFNL